MSKESIKDDIKKLMVEIDNIKKLLEEIVDAQKNNIRGLVETNSTLIHERLKTPTPIITTPDSMSQISQPSSKNNNTTIINITDANNGMVRVYGTNTFKYRDIIKKSGQGKAVWVSSTKEWMIPKQYYEGLVDELTTNFSLLMGENIIVSVNSSEDDPYIPNVSDESSSNEEEDYFEKIKSAKFGE